MLQVLAITYYRTVSMNPDLLDIRLVFLLPLLQYECDISWGITEHSFCLKRENLGFLCLSCKIRDTWEKVTAKMFRSWLRCTQFTSKGSEECWCPRRVISRTRTKKATVLFVVEKFSSSFLWRATMWGSLLLVLGCAHELEDPDLFLKLQI
jgi:hypothetical protein